MNYRKWKNIPSISDAERDNYGKKKLDYKVYLEKVVKDEEIKDWDWIPRIIKLWEYVVNKYNIPISKILDCGTRDGLFPEYLNHMGHDAIGIDINEECVNHARKMGRPVEYGDVCNLKRYYDETFDVTFSHYLLGLVKDYGDAIKERLRVTKKGGYYISLDCLHNSKKHYQLVTSIDQFSKIINGIGNGFKIIYLDSYDETLRFVKEEVLVILQKG